MFASISDVPNAGPSDSACALIGCGRSRSIVVSDLEFITGPLGKSEFLHRQAHNHSCPISSNSPGFRFCVHLISVDLFR